LLSQKQCGFQNNDFTSLGITDLKKKPWNLDKKLNTMCGFLRSKKI